jgi:hypothetical protein
MEGSFCLNTSGIYLFKLQNADYQRFVCLFKECGTRIGIGSLQNKNIMLTIVLFLTLLILCWVVYKSIDWFEKI